MDTRKAFEEVAYVLDSGQLGDPEAEGTSHPQRDADTGRVLRLVNFAPRGAPRPAQEDDMPSSPRQTPPEAGGKLSIGALSRATGIPVETLRTWEARYGFPVPERKPSGHRVYSLTSVPRLRRIAEALSQGHRAGDVVAATDEAIAALLSATAAPASGSRPLAVEPSESRSHILHAVEGFDTDRLTRILLQEWARLGPLDFLTSRLGPLIREVGDAWEAGRLEIRHEHFFSERVGDLLRSLRLPFEERAAGPLVVCSSLPGEQHALGLQMAALVLAVASISTPAPWPSACPGPRAALP
jgi:MerR family transcriptional regulator, light-induced transcriptional regulator